MIPNSSSTLVAAPNSGADSDSLLPILRWPILIAASLALIIFTLGRAGAVGAAAPTAYDSTICINYFTCYTPGTGATVANTTSGYPIAVAPTTTGTGYPANAVVSTYFDPRYCNGAVSVVTDASGNLIDVCAATGQRIFPVFPDYGNGFGNGFGSGFVGNGFVGANFVNGNAFANGGYANGFVNNGCPVGNFSCLGSYPFYGYPYSTGVYSGNYTVVAPGGKPIVVGAPYRVKEVAAPTSATTAVAQPAPAPVAAPAPQAVAPAMNTATALNTSNAAPATAPVATTGGGAGIHVLSASPATTPVVSKESDDHRG